MITEMAIAGAGWMGQTHARVYGTMPDARVRFIVDPDQKKAQALAALCPGAAAVCTLDEALADSAVTAVDICAPGFQHHALAMRAFAAGRHVLCEKPVAANVAEAEAMIASAQAAGVRFMVAHVLRFWPEYVAAVDALTAGRIGRLRRVSCLRLSETPAWSSRGWMVQAQQGGGAVRDLAVHDFDFLRWVAGMPTGVSAAGDAMHVQAVYQFADDVSASVEASYAMPAGFPFRMGFRLTGTDGTLEFDSGTGGVCLYSSRGGMEMIRAAGDTIVQGETAAVASAYVSEIRHFLDCVRSGRDSDRLRATDARDALAISLMTEAALSRGIAGA